jgi:hypothetical protein
LLLLSKRVAAEETLRQPAVQSAVPGRAGGEVCNANTQGGAAEPEPSFAHTNDYRSVGFDGQTHELTRNQATIIRVLHEAFQRGMPSVGRSTLMAAIESETGRVRDSFKNSPLWQTLIVSGMRKGTYRLNLPAHK